jgi:hypothetical protein
VDQPEGNPEPGQVEQFQAKCSADGAELVCTATKQLSVWIGQHIRRQGAEEMWDSVVLHCRAEADGTLVVRVLVFNPDWDDALQIASLRSRPGDLASLTPLGCNLDHVAIRIQRDAERPSGEQGGKESETGEE